MTFQTGSSGNPSGRPKGSGHRQQIFNDLVAPHTKVLIAKAITMAKEGDSQMLKIFLERILPAKPIDEPISLNLSGELTPEAAISMGKNILHLLDKEKITPEQAKSLFGVAKYYQENIAAQELLNVIQQLRADIDNIKNQSGRYFK